MGVFNDLTGQNFGRLTVICRIDNDKHGNVQWLCECSCEAHSRIVTTGAHLKSGHTKSCGCMKRENKEHSKYNTYLLYDDYGVCSMNGNNEFYFDLDDYDLVRQYYWSVNSSGYASSYYFTRDNNGKRIHHTKLLHRIIMNAPNNMDVDHINHNKLDNRKNNLRLCSSQQNDYNNSLSKRNTSGVIGVSYDKRLEKWRSYITFEGEWINLGIYFNKEDAIIARLTAELKYFKEFAPQQHLFNVYNIERSDEMYV